MFVGRIKTGDWFRSILYKSVRNKTKIDNNTNLTNLLFNNMLRPSRDRNHVVDAQKQRLKIKEKGSRYTPGTVTLQVLGSGGNGSPAALFLFTDQSRYMFNCGEGTQRLAHEHKTKLSRLEHIFVTRTSWSRIGGLPGLSLTVQDAGVPDLTLHGPPRLDEIFHGMRRFVVLKDLKVKTVDNAVGEFYEDQVLSIQSIPIKGKNQNSICNSRESLEGAADCTNTDNTNYFSYESGEDSEIIKQSNESKDFSANTGTAMQENVVVAYVCKLRPRPGALNLEKCVEKGVTPGPLLGQLKNGYDITLPNGVVVKSDEVRGPSDSGPVFIILDIPNEDYFKDFAKQAIYFENYQQTAEKDEDAALIVVHFTPQNIIETDLYQQFMEKFTPSTRHIILNSTNNFSGFLAAHRIQVQLNQLNENMFPLLKEDGDLLHNISSPTKKFKCDENHIDIFEKNLKESNENKFVFNDNVTSMSCFHLRPRKGLDRSLETILNPQNYIEESNAIEGFTESVSNLKINLKQNYINEFCEYPKIVFLGTGSCIPNKTRNVSSILIHTNDNSCILLDCGEGTLGQLIRFYGSHRSTKTLQNLKAIYISHLHADHHIGLIGLLIARKELFGDEVPPLLLFAPEQIKSWLNLYDRRIERINDTYILCPNGDYISKPFNSIQTHDMSIASLRTCYVRHCPHSFGVALELLAPKSESSIKITYSGDTTPCSDLVELGKNSTVLIHEATMEDELAAEAELKMHSTVTQAVNQGRLMNAKFIMLTHFSQRYAKLPRIENSMVSNVGIAFDNMEITLNNIGSLHLMYPTLKLMFSEHYEELEQRSIKRALKKARKRLSADSSPV